MTVLVLMRGLCTYRRIARDIVKEWKPELGWRFDPFSGSHMDAQAEPSCIIN